jgi:hypothetical protein
MHHTILFLYVKIQSANKKACHKIDDFDRYFNYTITGEKVLERKNNYPIPEKMAPSGGSGGAVLFTFPQQRNALYSRQVALRAKSGQKMMGKPEAFSLFHATHNWKHKNNSCTTQNK